MAVTMMSCKHANDVNSGAHPGHHDIASSRVGELEYILVITGSMVHPL